MRNTNTTRPATRASNGFTVIELLATLAVLALLVSAALPQLGRIIDRVRLTHEATALKLFLERAYAFVLMQREGVSIECSEQSLVAQRKSGEIVATHTISAGALLDLTSMSDRTILLHPSISASPATLNVQRADCTCQVIISLRGRVRIAC